MSTSNLVLALDVGTTNVKAAVVGSGGSLLRVAHREMVVERSDDGRAEHNPEALFTTVVDTLKEASEGYADQISLLVTATYQMGLIALNKAGVPLTGMMTLLDTRARQTHSDLLQAIPGGDLYNRTGCPPTFHYPLAKLYWLKTKRPDIYKEAAFFLSSKDYLLRRLANIDQSDISVSSTTQYMNIHSLTWDDDILSAVGIDKSTLPELAAPETLQTEGLDSLRKLLNLPKLGGVLFGAYDGGAVGIGLGGIVDGSAVMNFGTTAMLRRAASDPALSIDGSMQVQSSFLAAGKWIPGGAINNAGGVLRWLRDNIFKEDYEALSAEARAAGDTEGLIFLPYLTGERSIDIGAESSGSYYGLRPEHTRGHLVRAAFEGVAFSLRRIKQAAAKAGFAPSVIRVGSGGSHSPVWMEIVASVLDTPLQTTHADEPGLLGSGMLGYTALGIYPNIESATRTMVHAGHSYHPNKAEAKVYDAKFEKFNYLTQQMYDEEQKFGSQTGTR